MKYGIYGGSFDPIHIGHLTLAEHAVRECGLDRLIFMPAYISPFKQDRKPSAGIHRYRMAEAAAVYNASFRVSSYELNINGPSYTFLTLEHWNRILDGELSFILGFDSIVQVDTWYRGEDILRNYHLITARRPDTDDTDGMRIIDKYRSDYGADITVLTMEPIQASSSEIRRLISEGRSVTGLVPPEVEEYIISHELYR